MKSSRSSFRPSLRFFQTIAGVAISSAIVTTAVFTLVSPIERAEAVSSNPSFGLPSMPNIPGCPVSKRFASWGTFVQDGISFGDFASNWADIFVRNSCQRDDISGVQGAIDNLQHQLQQKIFSCQTAAVTTLSAKIHEAQFELEYLRNMMNTDEENPSTDGAKAVVRSPAALADLMRESTLVKNNLISSAQFSQFFAKFQAKYADRVSAYTDCKDSSWDDLRLAWNQFADTWAGLSPAWKKTEKIITSKVDALTSPTGRSGNFLSGLLDIRLNNLAPQQTLTDIANQVKKYGGSGKSGTGGSNGQTAPGSSATGSGGNGDLASTLSAAGQDYDRYIDEKSAINEKTYYETLYKQFGDTAGATMLKELAGEEKDGKKIYRGLNDIISDTLPIADQVRACVKAIGDKQCSK